MKILYFHPMVRIYRKTIFRHLADVLGCDFLLTDTAFLKDPKWKSSHIYKESIEIINENPADFIIAGQLFFNTLANFSLDIFKYTFSRKYQVSIYSGCTSVPFLATAFLAKLTGKKVVLFDELWRYPHELKKYQRIFPYVKFLIRNVVDAFVCAGSASKSMFVEEFGVEREKVFVAHNTTVDSSGSVLSENKRSEICERIRSFSRGRKVLLYLGRIVRYKGLDVLIKSMFSIECNACLIIVGSGPFQSTCQKQVSEMGLDDRICFLGGCRSDEAPYFYLNSDVFVLPTRFLLSEPVNCESWGFTVNEAMSHEVPVVATTAVGAAFDLIKDGETGLVAEENNSLHLAEKINYLLNNDARRSKIGKNGRQYLLELCSYNKNLEVYRDAVDFALDGQ